ncbi:variable surface lipoprotein [Mycoplasma sp. CSL7475-4]|uniref:MAG5150 family histidine triad lipoprotein n=1 Tax=Mycoplasma sp. CSL7475-4 TaxID=2973942 RepID=UPI00216B222E|nr:variable surface lipoprotein [Mycoplasma sp. CSL7475-4]MCS4537094.1 variable surface lipoprotein [Mycoplasma sp. CSL7475-4]
MKSNKIIFSLVTITSLPVIAASCQNNKKNDNENKKNDSATEKIKYFYNNYFLEYYKRIEKYLIYDAATQVRINESFNNFFEKFRTIKNISNKLRLVSDPVENGQLFLSDEELSSHFSGEKSEIYKKWLTTHKGVNLANNALGITDDAEIQIKSNSAYLKATDNSNQIHAFSEYLKSLGNKNFKDEEAINNINKLKQFVSDHIYNQDKWESDLQDSLLNEENHAQDNHSHTHSHATINIALNAIRQNNEFLDELEKLYALKSNFEEIEDKDKKDLIINNIFGENEIDIQEYREILNIAKDFLDSLREEGSNIIKTIESIENVIKI